MFVASERKMRAHQVLTFLLLFVITSVASENASTSRGCGLDLLPQYVSLCDLDAIWGIVVEAVAGAGALITLLLMLILLVRLPFLLITAFLSVLIWVAWMTMYLFGNVKLQQGDAWNDPTLAITLAASGWVFVIFHAIPEIHCTLLPALQENTPNYFDTSQPRMRETAFEEDVQLPRAYMENKAFSMDEHNAALRTAGFPNGSLGKRPSGSLGKRPSAPFRSNVYQPTEMAVVLNGGTIPTAPPSHTGRHLW
uniref:cDNA FLJ53055, highly similar to G-protein coupled receptor family C group 5 member B n=1 Tax=Homo sapiens TaxID=9606 RepID=B7Z440_HUMAN|nr:unnamed protein product [Homo sapiens]